VNVKKIENGNEKALRSPVLNAIALLVSSGYHTVSISVPAEDSHRIRPCFHFALSIPSLFCPLWNFLPFPPFHFFPNRQFDLFPESFHFKFD
jgi:hypothetical protein